MVCTDDFMKKVLGLYAHSFNGDHISIPECTGN